MGSRAHALRPQADLKRLGALYALAFSTPALYRGAAELAKAAGCSKTTQLGVAYFAFGLLGGLVWVLATRSSLAQGLKDIATPIRLGLPSLLCNPLIILAAISATIMTSIVIGPFGKDADILDETHSLTYRLILAIGAAVIVPIAEEVGGRWLLYCGLRPASANDRNGLDRFVATAPAILISGAAFGLFHYMVAGPTRMATTAIIGIILAAAYEWSATLVVPIATHMFINAQARLTADLGPTGRTIGIIMLIALALPAFVALARLHPSRAQT